MSKKAGGKKKKKPDEEDLTTEQLLKVYRIKCKDIPPDQIYKPFREKILDAIDDKDTLHLKKMLYLINQLHLFDPLKPTSVRLMMEALADVKYKHIASIKLVKAEINDEGVQQICNYMEKGSSVLLLNLPHNEISFVGCDFLGKTVGNTLHVKLKKLKLDFNNIGTKGLALLAKGLCMNPTLERLSLNFCNIDSNGAKYLQQILAYVDSSLHTLKLRGNFLRNEGIYQLFRALECNNWLQKLIVANNQFGESEEIPVIEKICEVMMKNNMLQIYDLDLNGIYDDGARKLFECYKMYKNIKRIPLQDLISKEIKMDFKKVQKKRKFKLKKKKKKKKKGKGKKKKKK